MSNFQIPQITPCPIPMTACFYDIDEMEITRVDVIFLAVIRMEGDDDFIAPMIGTPCGDFYDPCFDDNFLGMEYSGVECSWQDEIREMEEKAESEKLNHIRINKGTVN